MTSLRNEFVPIHQEQLPEQQKGARDRQLTPAQSVRDVLSRTSGGARSPLPRRAQAVL